MREVDRLYLDTNIFIMLAEGADSEVRRRLLDLVIAQVPSDRPFPCTSELTLAELLIHPYRTRNAALRQVYDNRFAPENQWMEVGPVERRALDHAAWVRADYPSVKLPDAIHVSTAMGFGCTHFLTFDGKLPPAISTTEPLTRAPIVAPELSIIEPTADMPAAILDNLS